MSALQYVFQQIERCSQSPSTSVLFAEPEVPFDDAPFPEPTTYVIDTTTVSGSLNVPYVDVRFLYRFVDLVQFPSVVSIQYMNLPVRTQYALVPKRKAKPSRGGFKHQSSIVVMVEQRAVDVKLFTNGKVNVVGALEFHQAEKAVNYLIRIIQSTSRPTLRPCFAIQEQEHVAPQVLSTKAQRLIRKKKQEEAEARWQHIAAAQEDEDAARAEQAEQAEQAEAPETENEEVCAPSRVGYTVMTAQPVSWSAERRYLLSTVQEPADRWVPFVQYSVCTESGAQPLSTIRIQNLTTTNIHCVFDCRFHIDRYKLYYIMVGQNPKYPDLANEFAVSFDPQKFPGVKWKNRDQGGTAFIFQQGKIVLTGISSLEHLNLMYRRICQVLRLVYHDVILRAG
jgi:TATA-box binding protein (TBP) (component of TFIID and TFIIIB)